MTTDFCCCCLLLPADSASPYLCGPCLEHIQKEYAHNYELPGCPVYTAYACNEPWPWEVAA